MKNSLFIWQFVGFIFTSVSGVILHFLYEWSGRKILIAFFSAVNESIWEHMKLIFFPMLFFAIIEKRFFSDRYYDFWSVKFVGILTGFTLIPVLYYTYTGAFGKSADWINITIFFLSVAISYLIETKILKKGRGTWITTEKAKLVLYIMIVLFILFTLCPPQIPLFQAP